MWVFKGKISGVAHSNSFLSQMQKQASANSVLLCSYAAEAVNNDLAHLGTLTMLEKVLTFAVFEKSGLKA